MAVAAILPDERAAQECLSVSQLNAQIPGREVWEGVAVGVGGQVQAVAAVEYRFKEALVTGCG